jgi:hypothetical protein
MCGFNNTLSFPISDTTPEYFRFLYATIQIHTR